jgi:hypothetical protein
VYFYREAEFTPDGCPIELETVTAGEQSYFCQSESLTARSAADQAAVGSPEGWGEIVGEVWPRWGRPWRDPAHLVRLNLEVRP